MNITRNVSIVIAGMVFAMALFGLFTLHTFAGTGHSVSGWAWGGGVDLDSTTADPPGNDNPAGYDGMGWISFNSTNCDTDSDGTVDDPDCIAAIDAAAAVGGYAPKYAQADYGVSIPMGAGDLSGYAWSDYYGWISFEDADIADCAPALAPAARTAGDHITGGARILAIKEAKAALNAGGYDGCIVFDHGRADEPTIDTAAGALTGYAWSSDLGWIDMSAVALTPPVLGPSLVICPATPPSIEGGGSGTVQLTAYYRDSGIPITCGTYGDPTDWDVTDDTLTAAADETTWSSADTAIATVGNATNPGLVTGQATAGGTIVTVEYDIDSNPSTPNLTAQKNISVGCTCVPTQDSVCAGVVYADSCGAAGSCIGTKVCPLIPQ